MQWANRLFGYGLLSDEDRKRLSQDQQNQLGNGALLDAGLAMLANSGYSYQPQTTGQALAQGVMTGRQSYAQNAQGMQEQMAQKAKQEQAMAALQSLPPQWQQYASVVGPERALSEYMAQQNKIALEGEKARLKPRDSFRNLTAAEKAELGIPKDSPAQINEATGKLSVPGGQTINVSTAQHSPFDKALAANDADTFTSWRDKAIAASDTLEAVDVLDKINSLQQGGKLGEAAAVIGQYFGTEAGANMQAFQTQASDLVLSQASRLTGVISDKDMELLEKLAPQFGNDPRANKVIIDILRRGASKAIANYEGADSHIQKTGGLRGYRPLFNSPAPVANPIAGSVDLSRMSTDELLRMAEEERKKRGQ